MELILFQLAALFIVEPHGVLDGVEDGPLGGGHHLAVLVEDLGLALVRALLHGPHGVDVVG